MILILDNQDIQVTCHIYSKWAHWAVVPDVDAVIKIIQFCLTFSNAILSFKNNHAFL